MSMKKLIGSRLKIYEDELDRFVWLACIFLTIFFAMAVLRNYVDAAFLKRYDVGKIPLMLVINGLLTCFVLEAMTRFWSSSTDSRLLAAFLFGFSFLTGGLFFAVRRSISFAYPALFQLLNLMDSILLVYLWNIASDLFDGRQGKRLFPLITLSQVLGTTIGNFTTDPIIHIFGMDSILVLFSISCASVGLLLTRTRWTRALKAAQSRGAKGPLVKTSEIPALMKRYPVIRYLIVLGLVPNILLPVFTYQFSVIVNGSFSSERSLAAFLAYFRGSMTLAVLGMLLFMGRLYSRMGLANATLVQPLNFAAIFGSLVVSFNIYTAALGQSAIRLVQQAIAGPAGKVLFNFVPGEIAAWSRVFVRGTVIKIAVVAGALLTLALKPVVSQRTMSAIALCIAVYWLIETFVFRKRYTAALKQVLVEERLDFDKMEASWAGAGMLYPTAAPVGAWEASPQNLEYSLEIPAIAPETALKMLHDTDEMTRTRAAASFAATRDPRAVSRLIGMLDDRDVVRRAAIEALIHYEEWILPVLESALDGSVHRVKRAVLEIMRLRGQKNADLSSFFCAHLLQAYNNLAALKVLSTTVKSRAAAMLTTHLEEENRRLMSLVFHALWIAHPDMRLMHEALYSNNTSIAVEMVENTLDRQLAQLIIPLIDCIPLELKIELGRKTLPVIRAQSADRVLIHMTKRSDPLTKMLATWVIGEDHPGPGLLPAVEPLTEDRDPGVRQVADYAARRCLKEEPPMPGEIELINTLRDFIIFDGMGMRELLAIAAIADRERYGAGDVLLREGETNPCLFLILKGRIDKYRNDAGAGRERLESLGPLGFFGEVRLFTELPSEETYMAAEPTEALLLTKYHFHEIMKIYPQIGLNLCLFFALRLTVRMEKDSEPIAMKIGSRL
jgi:hypothetical protein